MHVCCVFSLETPHRSDSNEYTQYTIFNILKKISLNYPTICGYWIFSKGLKDEFETDMVNEPSAFEPLKFDCIQDEYIYIDFPQSDLFSEIFTLKVGIMLERKRPKFSPWPKECITKTDFF